MDAEEAAALRDQEAFYRSLVDGLPQGVFRKDLDGRFTHANALLRAAMGKSLEDIVGKTDEDLFPPHLADKHRADDRLVIESGRTLSSVEEHVDADGRRRHVAIVKARVLDASGRVVGTQGVCWDVTAEKMAERRLAAQHAITSILAEAQAPKEAAPRILQAICEHLDWQFGALWIVDRSIDRLRCMDVWARPGVELEAFAHVTRTATFERGMGLPGRVWESRRATWIPDVAAERTFLRAEQARTAELHAGFAFPLVLGDEVLGVFDFLNREVREPDQATLDLTASVASQIAQVLARTRAVEALRVSEERFALAMKGANDGIWDWDLATDQVYFSPRWKSMLGHAEHEVRDNFSEWESRLHPDDRERARATIEEYLAGRTELYVLEHRLLHADGTYRWILARGYALRDENGKPYRMAGSHTDITEQKLTQLQLVQAEKLSSLGGLVAGVAHEINNPLAFVSNNVAVLQRDLEAILDLLRLHAESEDAVAELRPDLLKRIRAQQREWALDRDGPDLIELVARSRDGLARIQRIVADLRDFARLDEREYQEVDLCEGIVSTVNIVKGRAREAGVLIELDLGGLPQVACHPAKINQVVLNLLTNAIDACEGGGRVCVKTAEEAHGVSIRVDDTGPGIAAEVRERIFDPFFTTKPTGLGMGLGLSISHGVVQDHGGTIEVGEAPGGGARFVVHLPLRPSGTATGAVAGRTES